MNYFRGSKPRMENLKATYSQSLQSVGGLEKNLPKLAVSYHPALSSEIQESHKNLKEEIMRIEEHTNLQYHDLLKEADQHRDSPEGLNRRICQVQRDATSNAKDIVSHCLDTAAVENAYFEQLEKIPKRLGKR